MSRSVTYRLIAGVAVALGVGAMLYGASPAQAAPPSAPGTIAQLQAEIDAQQQQVDQQAAQIGALQQQVNQQAQALATKQDIINGICSQGQNFSQVNADGSVVCTSDSVHLTVVSDTRHLDSGQAGTILLSCPAGSSATGGGFDGVNTVTVASGPSGSGWSVTALAFFASGDFHAFAICAANTP